MTAIAPVLFIATAIAALGLGEDAASHAVHRQLSRIMTSESADLVQLAILHLRNGAHTLAGGLIGVATLVITASGFFTEVEDALNTIWKAPRHESYFYQLLRGRVLSLLLVIGLGVLLLASMFLATGIRLLEMDHYRGVRPSPAARVGVAQFPKQLIAAGPWLADLESAVKQTLTGKSVLLVWGMLTGACLWRLAATLTDA